MFAVPQTNYDGEIAYSLQSCSRNWTRFAIHKNREQLGTSCGDDTPRNKINWYEHCHYRLRRLSLCKDLLCREKCIMQGEAFLQENPKEWKKRTIYCKFVGRQLMVNRNRTSNLLDGTQLSDERSGRIGRLFFFFSLFFSLFFWKHKFHFVICVHFTARS